MKPKFKLKLKKKYSGYYQATNLHLRDDDGYTTSVFIAISIDNPKQFTICDKRVFGYGLKHVMVELVEDIVNNTDCVFYGMTFLPGFVEE